MPNGVLVHEWLAKTGGSENVFDAMVEAFPEADLLCLWDDLENRYEGRIVRESWLARTPLRHQKAAALPFMPSVWRNRPGDYDWALVSSHLFAHHVSFKDAPRAFRKYVYVHSPARYIWNPELDERGSGWLPRIASPTLRKLDHQRAQEATDIAANSNYVKDRVRRSWEREAVVINPPVEVAHIQSISHWRSQLDANEELLVASLPSEYILGASRFIPYKRLDLVIRMGEAAGVPVVLAGAGPEESRLRALAEASRVPVFIVSSPGNALLYALYQGALAYVFPAIEDFGIMPVEAMATGTAVVVATVGGASETVVDGSTGAHVANFLSNQECRSALDKAAAINSDAARERSRDYSAERFANSMRDWIAG